MRRKSNARPGNLVSYFALLTMFWGPIVVGVVHQLAMIIGRSKPDPERFDQIPVFVDPPGTIGPFATLEYQWWLVLTMTTALMCFLILSHRFSSLPRRVAAPFYIYLLFLLILVKPIW